MLVLGDSNSAVDRATSLVTGFLASSPNPTQAEIAAFLALMPGEERELAAQQLAAHGVPAQVVYAARMALFDRRAATWKTYATVAAAAGAAFHGYRRSRSLGWGLVWFALGSLFPITTTVVALAQGYGVRKEA